MAEPFWASGIAGNQARQTSLKYCETGKYPHCHFKVTHPALPLCTISLLVGCGLETITKMFKSVIYLSKSINTVLQVNVLNMHVITSFSFI